MAKRYIKMGPAGKVLIFNDDAGDMAFETDGGIRTTRAPTDPSDVLRKGDTSDGSITELVLGDGTNPKWRLRNVTGTPDELWLEYYNGSQWLRIARWRAPS